MKKPCSESALLVKKTSLAVKAKSLFLVRGIEDVKMTDIASYCRIGVATLYRYFSLKKTLVIFAGTLIWNDLFSKLKAVNEEKSNSSGFEAIKSLADYILQVFSKHSFFFVFLRQFDAFIIKEKASKEDLSSYEKAVREVEGLFIEEGMKGIKDGSVRKDCDLTLLYYAFGKALIGLGEKLSAENNLLISDADEDSAKQMQILADSFLTYIKKEKAR